MLSGRVFDARNRSFQPQVGAILTREWAYFRLTKTIQRGNQARRFGFGKVGLYVFVREGARSPSRSTASNYVQCDVAENETIILNRIAWVNFGL
jgi:hypothetical protein